MNFLKYTSYLYLVFGILFIYDGFAKLNANESPYMSFAIAGVTVFMFFFRRKFAKKFDTRNKQS